MISVTRLDGSALVINSDHILTIEQTPDTVLALTTGVRVMVKESAAELIDRVVAFRKRFHYGEPTLAEPARS